MEKSRKKNIYLVGLMGAGKTVIGKNLAKRLKLNFRDSDHVIEEHTGVRISTIFEIEGEDGFRRREAQTIAELSELEETVVSTGGGAVLYEENRLKMKSSGFVIYLNVPPRVLWERLRYDRERPLLNVPDPLLKLQELFRARDALYRDAADLVVNGERMKMQTILLRLISEMGERWKP
ncbi:MAG: shikimate kinase [Candidatus Accumulibacter sp.]|nr:shikimate kinase [Accumulibacter sp.]